MLRLCHWTRAAFSAVRRLLLAVASPPAAQGPQVQASELRHVAPRARRFQHRLRDCGAWLSCPVPFVIFLDQG